MPSDSGLSSSPLWNGDESCASQEIGWESLVAWCCIPEHTTALVLRLTRWDRCADVDRSRLQGPWGRRTDIPALPPWTHPLTPAAVSPWPGTHQNSLWELGGESWSSLAGKTHSASHTTSGPGSAHHELTGDTGGVPAVQSGCCHPRCQGRHHRAGCVHSFSYQSLREGHHCGPSE